MTLTDRQREIMTEVYSVSSRMERLKHYGESDRNSLNELVNRGLLRLGVVEYKWGNDYIALPSIAGEYWFKENGDGQGRA